MPVEPLLDASAANAEARRFYERHGYRLRGVLMTKPLDADPARRRVGA